MGGTWSCCLPCAGGGGRGPSGAGKGVKKSTGNINKKSSLIVHSGNRRNQHHHHQLHHKGITDKISEGDKRLIDSDLDDIDLDDCVVINTEDTSEITAGCFTGKKNQHNNNQLHQQNKQEQQQEENSKEGGTQHRLSPRLHDIEEEDDEDCRHIKER